MPGPPAWVPVWLTQTDLENATTPTTVIQCFDDAATSTVNAPAVADVIARAESETLSWLDEFGPPPFNSTILAQLGGDQFLKTAAQARAVILMYDRAPETVRQTVNDLEKRRKDWNELMTRIKDARQRPPNVPTPPANVGGVIVDNGARIYADSADGTKNSGDY